MDMWDVIKLKMGQEPGDDWDGKAVLQLARKFREEMALTSQNIQSQVHLNVKCMLPPHKADP